MGKRTKLLLAVVIFLVATAAPVHAQTDLDNYKVRIDADWWFAHPSGYFGLQGSNSYVDINRDFGFGSYSTGTAKIDWHFKHKHHFLLDVTPNNNESKSVTLSRQIEFEGDTFDLGAQASARIKILNIAPGYQYDIIRRNHGFVGIELDFNVIHTTVTLHGTGTVNGVTAFRSASNSLWAPLPAVGPVGRWYPLHDSNRLALEGSLRGMGFFGYGNFVTARAKVDIGLTNHLALQAGYEMGSRLSIHGTSDQIAVQLTHRGPTAGIEYSFGDSPAPKPKNPPSTEPSNWHADWVPFYLWFSGVKGDVGAGGYTAPVDASFGDIFSQLNIGLMTALDVRRKRVGLLTDIMFMSLSSDQKTTPIQGGAYSGFKANAKTFWVDPELYFRVLDKDKFSVDAVGGFRFWHLNNSLDLFPGTITTEATVGQTQSWVDPVLGARFHVKLNKGWFGDLKGDAGGFGVGSQQTYQIYAGLGKTFKERFAVLLGYRYLYVDYVNGGFVYDTHMQGPLMGFLIHIK